MKDSTQTNDIFVAGVKRTFSFLKATGRFDELLAKSIIIEEPRSYLVPVGALHATDEKTINLLADWRQASSFAYPSRFNVTAAGTEKWLRESVLSVEDKILFLLLDEHGNPVGHLGFTSAFKGGRALEIDNVVRGVKGVLPGGMRAAITTLVDWAEEVLGAESFYLRVLESNQHAVEFYESMGFVADGVERLRRVGSGDEWKLVPVCDGDDPQADDALVKMAWRPEKPVVGGKMILTAGPSISAREVTYALDAVRNGWNSNWSDYLDRFERSFADYVGVKHAISTSSCTGALHIALAALGIGPGDEVIVPSITWVATANAVAYVGATPVFADVERETWCIDPSSAEALISAKTKAIMPVHLYGHPARMDAVMEIAARYSLYVVEDAAPAIGALYSGQKCGTFGSFAAFSFQGAKLAVSGEGGMLVTDDDELYARAHLLWDQGRTPGTFWINETGLKYKMSNVQAAIGLAQVERVDELIEAKRKIWQWYAEGLSGIEGITLLKEQPPARSICWMVSLLVEPGLDITRDRLRSDLRGMNIDTRPVYPELTQFPMWTEKRGLRPMADYIGENGLNLPSGVRLKRHEVEYVCSCVRAILSDARVRQ